MAVESQVLGLQEISRKLREVPLKLERKVLQQALRAGATVIRKEAQRLVPVRTGNIKRNIVVRRSRNTRNSVYVGVRRLSKKQISAMKSRASAKGKALRVDPRDPYYWWFIEFGFVHAGEPATVVPGSRFMTRAFETRKRAAVVAIEKKMREAFEREIGDRR